MSGCDCLCCYVIGPSEAQKAKDAERSAELWRAAFEKNIAPLIDEFLRFHFPNRPEDLAQEKSCGVCAGQSFPSLL